jgi:hypothetical protein
MTGIALHTGSDFKMIVWHRGRTATRTVACTTHTCSFGTVNPSAAGEGCGRMTEVAIQISRWVSRYRSLLADGANSRTRTIMTGFASVHDTRVIESADESCGCMTDTTIQTSHRMIRWFTDGHYTIMTGRAVIEDTGMIKCPRYKTCGDVTHTTIIGRWHMVGGWFSCCRITVTSIASTLNTSMIKLGTGKGRGVMAHGAILIVCLNVTKTQTSCATTIRYVAP